MFQSNQKNPPPSTTTQCLEGEIRGFIEGVAEFHQALLSADHGDRTLPGGDRWPILSMASGDFSRSEHHDSSKKKGHGP